jgi:hypothetical protein
VKKHPLLFSIAVVVILGAVAIFAVFNGWNPGDFDLPGM